MESPRERLLLNESTVEPYKWRWVFLFARYLLNACSMFSSVCFGLVDDVFTRYFKISYASADWITLAVYVTSCLVAPILAWLSFANRMGLRRLILVESLSLTLSYVFMVVAIAYNSFYVFIILGQLIHGVANAIQWSIPPLFAVLWFPNNEVGFAIAVNFIGAATGAFLGLFLPPYFLISPPPSLHATENVAVNRINATVTLHIVAKTSEDWENVDRTVLLIIFIPWLVLTSLLFFFFTAFIPDLPPKPPTIAQALKRAQRDKTIMNFNWENFKKFLALVFHLFSDRTYISLVIVFGIVHRAVILEFTLMGELVRAIAPSVQLRVTPNQLASYVMILYPICAAIGSVVSGKLSDKFGKYRKQALLGAFMTFFFTLCLAISYYFRSFVGICVSNGGFAFSTRICIISLLAVVTRHTFPIDESFVSIWLTGLESVVLIIMSEIGRVLINYVSDESVLIFMCSSLFFSFLLAVVTKPTDKRLEAEEEVMQLPHRQDEGETNSAPRQKIETSADSR